jgi:hypothetical protein
VSRTARQHGLRALLQPDASTPGAIRSGEWSAERSAATSHVGDTGACMPRFAGALNLAWDAGRVVAFSLSSCVRVGPCRHSDRRPTPTRPVTSVRRLARICVAVTSPPEVGWFMVIGRNPASRRSNPAIGWGRIPGSAPTMPKRIVAIFAASSRYAAARPEAVGARSGHLIRSWTILQGLESPAGRSRPEGHRRRRPRARKWLPRQPHEVDSARPGITVGHASECGSSAPRQR